MRNSCYFAGMAVDRFVFSFSDFFPGEQLKGTGNLERPITFPYVDLSFLFSPNFGLFDSLHSSFVCVWLSVSGKEKINSVKMITLRLTSTKKEYFACLRCIT